MTAAVKSAPRQTLSTQLDRLDSILDGLADGLNQAVADAVRGAVAQAVSEAVRAAVAELAGNPELAQRFHAAASHLPVAEPTQTVPANGAAHTASRSGRTAAILRGVAANARRRLDNAREVVAERLRPVRAWVGGQVALLRDWRKPLLASAGVALGAALFGSLAGPLAAGLLCGAIAFAASVLAATKLRPAMTPADAAA
jgi:hypothetical protein